jgi:flagellar assembly protein FliH
MMNSFTNASTGARAQKFEFEPMFEGRAAAARKKVITEEDVAAARAEGFAQGQAEANASIERSASEASRAIANMMQMMLGSLADEAQSLRTDAAEVAMAAAKSVATVALEAFGDEAVADIVTTAIDQLRDAPRFVVTVSPDLVDLMQGRLTDCARHAGFYGEVVVRSDPAAARGDCKLDWGDGTITHDRAKAFELIDQAAQKWLASSQAEGFPINTFQT